MKFAALHADFQTKATQAAKATLLASGFSDAVCQRATGTGLSWLNLLTLVGQFIGTYGLSTVQIIADVALAVATIVQNPASAIATIQGLVTADGPEILTLAAAIAAIFGVTLPPVLTGTA